MKLSRPIPEKNVELCVQDVSGVAGTVAGLIQVRPEGIIAEVKKVVDTTATYLGGPVITARDLLMFTRANLKMLLAQIEKALDADALQN